MSRVFTYFAPDGEWSYDTISHRVLYIGQVTWRTYHPIPYTPLPPSEYSTRVSYCFPVPPGFVWQPPHPDFPIPADGIVPLPHAPPHLVPPILPPLPPAGIIEISDDEEEMNEGPAEDDFEEEPMEEDPEEEPMEEEEQEEDPEEILLADEDEEEEIEIMDFEDNDEGSVVTDL